MSIKTEQLQEVIENLDNISSMAICGVLENGQLFGFADGRTPELIYSLEHVKHNILNDEGKQNGPSKKESGEEETHS